MTYLRSSCPVVLAAALVLGLVACGDREAVQEEPVKTEEEIRMEQEAAQRAEAAAALDDRVSAVSGTAGDLARQADSGSLPESIAQVVGDLEGKRGEVERLLSELQAAGADGWEAARSRLETALAELESASASAAGTVEEWQAREAAVLASREAGESPIDPETGLIQGLDGGDYEPYKESVVVQVQEVLRQQGRYAGPADGRFDRALLEAVGGFQEEQELQVSGVPSPMTRSRLFG